MIWHKASTFLKALYYYHINGNKVVWLQYCLFGMQVQDVTLIPVLYWKIDYRLGMKLQIGNEATDWE